MFIFNFLDSIFSDRLIKKWAEDVEKSKKEEPQEIEFNSITKTDNSIQYPISQHTAFVIANQDQNLKTDFCKNDNRHISYLNFNDYNIKQINYNNEPHWHIEITKGDISWIDDYETLSDGFLIEEDLKKLQCLVNINTGKYKYFPAKKEF